MFAPCGFSAVALLAVGLLAGCSDGGGRGGSGGGASFAPESVVDSGSGAEPAQDVERDVAPEFALDRLSGGQMSLAELRGKTVVIDFWATWCPPCEFQVPALNEFYETHYSKGDIEVLGISIDLEGPEVVSAWTEEKDVRYPVLLGDPDLAKRYGAMGFPTTVIVAPDGKVDSTHTGLIEVETLESALARHRSS